MTPPPVELERTAARFVPFAYGFRPFFLLAGWFAMLAIGAWIWLYFSGRAILPGLPSHFWHGHEMLFGFVAAAIAGFMLTSVPSWTGSSGFGGPPLMLLTAVWLMGRVGFALAAAAPFWLLAVVELAFLPLLAALIAPPLVRARNRNRVLLFVLAALWACDALFMLAWGTGNAELAASALRATLNVVLLLVTVIGGRIVPAFTGNALRANGVEVRIPDRPWLERAVIGLMLANLLLDALLPVGEVTGVLAAAAGLAHLLRLAGWQGFRALRQPIVWVLHAGYAWLPVGLLLKACFLLGGLDWAAFWMHALGAGAASTMIIAVMSRASLGHTGRPLRAHAAMAWAYGLLFAAVLVRVLGPALLPGNYRATILLAGGLWMAAFLIYVVIYTPILLRPRVDAKPG